MPTYKNIGKGTIIVDNLCNYRFDVGVETSTKFPHTPINHSSLQLISTAPMYNPVLSVDIPILPGSGVVSYDVNQHTNKISILNNTNGLLYFYYEDTTNEPSIPITISDVKYPTEISIERNKIEHIAIKIPVATSEGDVIITQY